MQENKTTTQPEKATSQAPGANRGNGGKGGNRGGQQRGPRKEPEKSADGIDTRVLASRRVSRMYHGGRRMRFSAFVVAGDRTGRVGVGSAKGLDVASSQKKASQRAKAEMDSVILAGNTIPHEVEFKFKATKVLLKPAAPGTGIIAGSTVKAVAELVGIKDLLTKVHGSRNTINTAYATMGALKTLRNKRL